MAQLRVLKGKVDAMLKDDSQANVFLSFFWNDDGSEVLASNWPVYVSKQDIEGNKLSSSISLPTTLSQLSSSVKVVAIDATK